MDAFNTLDLNLILMLFSCYHWSSNYYNPNCQDQEDVAVGSHEFLSYRHMFVPIPSQNLDF